MTGLSAPQRHNKIWKMIYVALTRAQKQMIVALDYSLYSGTPDKGALKKGLEDLGFAKYSAETSSKRVVSQMPITLEEWRFSVSGGKRWISGYCDQENANWQPGQNIWCYS